MPVYEYLCKGCGHEFEREQRISDAPVKKCPSCGALKARRQISRTSFVLKGGGWYSDLYGARSPPRRRRGEADAGDEAATPRASPPPTPPTEPTTDADREQDRRRRRQGRLAGQAARRRAARARRPRPDGYTRRLFQSGVRCVCRRFRLSSTVVVDGLALAQELRERMAKEVAALVAAGRPRALPRRRAGR